MKIFKSFNQTKECANTKSDRKKHNEDYPFKLVEPSVDNVIEIEVIDDNEIASILHMGQLIEYVNCIEDKVLQWEIEDKKIMKIIFFDIDDAEEARKIWR